LLTARIEQFLQGSKPDRSIGLETLTLHAVMQLQLDQKLTALGFNKIDAATALYNVVFSFPFTGFC
jgi:hypothetical protein